MSRECFTPKNFRADSLAKIAIAELIIEKYQAMGLKLTLRQLYYQFVAHYELPNTERSYKNLGNLISDARLAGMIDWDAIEDRGREPNIQADWSSAEDVVRVALKQFRLPRWRGQDNYVELWVEKQALAGVLKPIAYEKHVTLMVNKGYSSQSAMYESAQRFMEAHEQHQDLVLIYLGDHDPSGEDMVRDVADRLELFGAELEVRKLALTMDQVEEYNPPPNPAKMSDSRAEGYVAKHGDESWEVDAIDPAELRRLIEEEIDSLVDQELMDEVIREEDEQRDKVRLAVAKALHGGT